MESESTPPSSWSGVVATAAIVVGNLAVLMFVPAAWAADRDVHDTGSSGSPITDGVLAAVLVVVVLLLVNGLSLVASPRTRRLGYGILLGLVAAVPLGFALMIFLITSFTS